MHSHLAWRVSRGLSTHLNYSDIPILHTQWSVLVLKLPRQSTSRLAGSVNASALSIDGAYSYPYNCGNLAYFVEILWLYDRAWCICNWVFEQSEAQRSLVAWGGSLQRVPYSYWGLYRSFVWFTYMHAWGFNNCGLIIDTDHPGREEVKLRMAEDVIIPSPCRLKRSTMSNSGVTLHSHPSLEHWPEVFSPIHHTHLNTHWRSRRFVKSDTWFKDKTLQK